MRGKTHDFTTRPIEEVLIYGKLENTNRLKCRLLRDGVKEHKCERCALTQWQGTNIPLEIHHEDGDRYNNNLENLRLLCPNCHALTDNYRGKNKESVKQPDPEKLKKNPIFIRVAKPKKEKPPKPPKPPKIPYQQPTKRPPKDILERLIWERPTTHIAKEYGVSDSAVKKWCQTYNITKPPVGYWAKVKAGKWGNGNVR